MAPWEYARHALLLLLSARAEHLVHDSPDSDACTSMIVGRGATVDGSVMATHANDCSECDFRMVYVAARDWPEGSVSTVYDGTWSSYPRLIDPDRSPLLTGGAGIVRSAVTGSIPQVPHTFALWENSYSLMNEKGLALGESTCSAHLFGKSTLAGGDDLFSIGPLMSLALERCETARCAVQTMGDLGTKYGFYGEEGGKPGAGEAVTAVDATGEAWVFHILGGVPATGKSDRWLGQRGALWAAQRVPDGNIAVLANNFIIREVDPEDTDNFIVHPGLFELTQEAGLWDGTGPFDFLEIMTPDVRFFRYMPAQPPMPRYVTARQWNVWRTVAKKSGLRLTDNPREYPFSVPVDRKLTHLEVMDLHKSHYEGTELDMTLGALAGPFQSPNRIEGGAGLAKFPGQATRASSIPRTSYTMVCQTGGSSEPAVWFAPDGSASSVFVPFYARVLSEGGGKYDIAGYGVGSNKGFDFNSVSKPAWWAFNFVANYMEKNYKNMSEEYVYPKVRSLQLEVADRAAAAVAKARAGGGAAVLAEVQSQIQRDVTEEWWNFAGMLMVRYNDNFFNFGEYQPEAVGSFGLPAFWLEMIGFDNEAYYPTWLRRSYSIPDSLPDAERSIAIWAEEQRNALNRPYDSPLSAATEPVASGAGVAVVAAIAGAGGILIGLAVGQTMGRRAATKEAARADYIKMGL